MKYPLAVAASVAALVVPLIAQAPQQQPAFEAASIKPNKGGDNRVSLGFQPGGRFNAVNVTPRMLIAMAYGTPQPLPDSRVIGGPNWINSDRFDVVAKAEGDQQAGLQGPPTQMFLMIRSLLADRFKLKAHNESREMPIYALVLSRTDRKLGPELHESSIDCSAMRGRRAGGAVQGPPDAGQNLQCGLMIGPGVLAGGGSTMANLATALSRFVNRVVVDQTGLTGSYDLNLKWTPDQLPQSPAGGPPPGAPALPPIDPNGPSIFTAVQEQLGLKLDSERAPVDVVVIDSIDHPTED